jgi:hypothetical protein
MSKMNRPQGFGPRPPGQPQPASRPGLLPADPLPGWKALVQATVLLGIPLTLLLLAKLILRKFFPSLGY